MIKRLRFALIAFCLLLMPDTGRAQLPPEVQADLLKTKLTTAMREKKFGEVLTIIDKMRTLKVPLPGSIDYFEGYAAAETDDWVRAHDRVTGFLKKGGRGHKLYSRALELYARVEPHVEAARKAQQEKAAAERAAALEELNATVDQHLESNDFAGAGKAVDQAIADGKLSRAPEVRARINEAQKDHRAEQQQQIVRDKTFANLMQTAGDYFANELNHRFESIYAWSASEKHGPDEEERGSVTVSYLQTVKWGGPGAPCTIFVQDNHQASFKVTYESYNYTGSANGHDDTYTHTSTGNGSFFLTEIYPYEFKTKTWPSVPRLPGIFRKQKYVGSGTAPQDVIGISISHGENQSTYAKDLNIHGSTRFHLDNTRENESRTKRGTWTSILGSRAQMTRYDKVLTYLRATCICRDGEPTGHVAGGWSNCSEVPASPPVFSIPKPVYEAPVLRPVSSSSSYEPEEERSGD